ncbi:hypothetical protein GTQ43_03795 [Nostoc sp. KVJ3]|uniref:hypothetical protein n=1 Tax=Nostoc sp. KVJ3 TaxID=457945 RepID=UPI0022370A49|nr:hypothetical protein [Nostoc sp. KVJ3]MCW5313002.1 hypothetical protein [Nostoc sp. KVJ3]
MIVIITPRITSTIPAITPVKSIVIVESWAITITRYVRWGQLHICFAVKFLIAAFTDEIHEVIIPGDRISGDIADSNRQDKDRNYTSLTSESREYAFFQHLE